MKKDTWYCVYVLLSCVQLFLIPWTIACQAPLSMEFSGKNTGMGCHFLLQGIFLTHGSNLSLLHCRQTLYPLSHQGSIAVLYVRRANRDGIRFLQSMRGS